MKREPVQIETERLLLRHFTPLDQDDLLAILGDEETMRFSERAFSREQTNHFLLDFCVKRQNAFAAESRETGHVIGYLLFHETDPEIYEIGWFFNRQVWGKGYAWESASALLMHAFSVLHAHKVVAETTDNARSGKLMRRLGMTFEGVQRRQVRDQGGNWVDLYLYGIFPREVKPFSHANTQKKRNGGIDMKFQEFFSLVKGRMADVDVSNIHENVAFQFDITGEEAGTFYVELKNGKLSVEPYEYYDRDAKITCSADTLIKIATGKLDPVAAFTFRKIKVEGKLEKALLLKQLLK